MVNVPIIDMAATGKRIAALRDAAGLTVRDLQDILGFANPQAIYKWQHGTALPTLDNLVILANAFDVAMDDIIVVEDNAHDGAYYRRWASVYGESMVTPIDRILRSSKHEEQAYNSCAGVLHSCKDVPHRLVQEAAEKCVEANACKYSYFKKALGMVRNNHSSSGMNGT